MGGGQGRKRALGAKMGRGNDARRNDERGVGRKLLRSSSRPARVCPSLFPAPAPPRGNAAGGSLTVARGCCFAPDSVARGAVGSASGRRGAWVPCANALDRRPSFPRGPCDRHGGPFRDPARLLALDSAGAATCTRDRGWRPLRRPPALHAVFEPASCLLSHFGATCVRSLGSDVWHPTGPRGITRALDPRRGACAHPADPGGPHSGLCENTQAVCQVLSQNKDAAEFARALLPPQAHETACASPWRSSTAHCRSADARVQERLAEQKRSGQRRRGRRCRRRARHGRQCGRGPKWWAYRGGPGIRLGQSGIQGSHANDDATRSPGGLGSGFRRSGEQVTVGFRAREGDAQGRCAGVLENSHCFGQGKTRETRCGRIWLARTGSGVGGVVHPCIGHQGRPWPRPRPRQDQGGHWVSWRLLWRAFQLDGIGRQRQEPQQSQVPEQGGVLFVLILVLVLWFSLGEGVRQRLSVGRRRRRGIFVLRHWRRAKQQRVCWLDELVS